MIGLPSEHAAPEILLSIAVQWPGRVDNALQTSSESPNGVFPQMKVLIKHVNVTLPEGLLGDVGPTLTLQDIVCSQSPADPLESLDFPAYFDTLHLHKVPYGPKLPVK